MPNVNPAMTGKEIKSINFPSFRRPRISRMIPAKAVVIIRPAGPNSLTIGIRMTMKAAVGPET